jgi:BlaI family transcriptional regulator, penicillinase repressor
MARITAASLTRREAEIMEVLYRRRRGTVEEIRAEIPRPPSPSSVRKLLEILMKRGHVTRAYEHPRFYYSPASAPEEASRSALRKLVRTFFDGSPGATIAALLDLRDGPLSDAEYQRLSELLANARDGGDK